MPKRKNKKQKTAKFNSKRFAEVSKYWRGIKVIFKRAGGPGGGKEGKVRS